MFKVTGSSSVDCEGFSRRSFVQAGMLGLGGLSLADFLQVRAEGAARGPSGQSGSIPLTDNDTSVILFWMSGGPGHHETWDPKPEAVSQYRGPFDAIPTNVPGVQFCETLPDRTGRPMHLIEKGEPIRELVGIL